MKVMKPGKVKPGGAPFPGLGFKALGFRVSGSLGPFRAQRDSAFQFLRDRWEFHITNPRPNTPHDLFIIPVHFFFFSGTFSENLLDCTFH